MVTWLLKSAVPEWRLRVTLQGIGMSMARPS
jgi:hypothetical protein